MSTSSKKKLIINTVSVKLGCGSCRRPNLSNIFNPKPRKRTSSSSSSSSSYLKKPHAYNSSSSSSWDTTTATFSSQAYYSSDTTESHDHIKSSRAVQGFGKIGGQSVAVEKDSEDPYLDFRQSMLQMILEKELYSKKELKELLNCFLQLNSPYYHGIIVRAFTEIWNGVFSVKPTTLASPNFHGGWN